ncbi:MAG: rRNA maturation RNase YbeY [Anaplasma sp.]
MIEVSVYAKGWCKFVSRPRVFAKNVIRLCLSELDVAKYRPRVFIVLAGDALLKELNYRYRKVNKTTNVLSFNYEDLAPNCCLGEIYLSIDQIVLEAREMEIEVTAHFSHMLIHGMLHILGYDHDEHAAQEEMQSIEIKLLEKLGISNPYVSRET